MRKWGYSDLRLQKRQNKEMPNADNRSRIPEIWIMERDCFFTLKYRITVCVRMWLFSPHCRLGVLGNTLVVLSVIRHKSLQSVRNIFIVSLSVTDIVISVVSGSITPITAFTKIWLFGEFLCYLVPLMQVSRFFFRRSLANSIWRCFWPNSRLFVC